MKQHNLLRPLIGGALLLMVALPVLAQPGGRGPRDGDGPSRGERGPREGMRRGPERGPRAKGELNRIWHDIADLEEGNLALSQSQSAQIVALVLPVSKQQTLGDGAAKSLAGNIEAILTDAQLAEIEKNRPRDGGPRDVGPRDVGPPRMNREDGEKVRSFMDALNPFYPPTGYATFKDLPADFAKDVAKRYGERREFLEKLSKRGQSK